MEGMSSVWKGRFIAGMDDEIGGGSGGGGGVTVAGDVIETKGSVGGEVRAMVR